MLFENTASFDACDETHTLRIPSCIAPISHRVIHAVQLCKFVELVRGESAPEKASFSRRP